MEAGFCYVYANSEKLLQCIDLLWFEPVIPSEKDNDRQQEEENGKFMNTVGYYGNYNSKKQLHNYAQIIFHALEMVQLKTVKQ